MCPIETPEGPNIGLITSLATYARVNITASLRLLIVFMTRRRSVVTADVYYMTADEEDLYNIAQANEPLDKEGRFLGKKIVCRNLDQFLELNLQKVDYMDVSLSS